MQANEIFTSATSQEMILNYVEIVEKTNNQLSHWVNVSNWIIACLGVFIALIAIFVGYALFKNSKEQKEQQESFFKKIEERAENVERKTEEKIDRIIKSYEEKLNNANEKDKVEIQKEIKDLEKKKIELGAVSSPVFYPFSRDYQNEASMVCAECGNVFSYISTKDEIFSVGDYVPQSHISNRIYCVHCGAENIIQ